MFLKTKQHVTLTLRKECGMCTEHRTCTRNSGRDTYLLMARKTKSYTSVGVRLSGRVPAWHALGPLLRSLHCKEKQQTRRCLFLSCQLALSTDDHSVSAHTWVSLWLPLTPQSLPVICIVKYIFLHTVPITRLYNPDIDPLWLVATICSLLLQYGF